MKYDPDVHLVNPCNMFEGFVSARMVKFFLSTKRAHGHMRKFD